ncbi:MAG TPA: bifunctional DNA-formamidopyrimidine glycosylase/DNA-(apurinic or apyrimidinic site) lyase [Chloroflexi bacterium]|nr:bifunctional DNA-formamidopyrimidine glycosylase/DNA-(apurinic or apyrimidinic site) lyase [Chloroflexota bacterium]
MPELPEVEMVAQGLRSALVGSTIVSVTVYWARSIALPDADEFARRLEGESITDVGRRGKWVLLTLGSGSGLLIHLRMTGQLILQEERPVNERHLRVLFALADGRWLCFFDQRKFGRMVLTTEPQGVVRELGPEPLEDEFTAATFAGMLARRRGSIKPLLLNQRFLAGLGNIYTDEALWRAGIHPLRRADSLTPDEAVGLHGAVRAVLREAIASGGTTLADTAYRQPDGQAGAFGGLLAVYGRAGQPCPRCGAEIERTLVGQRGTHICPHCQPRPVGE